MTDTNFYSMKNDRLDELGAELGIEGIEDMNREGKIKALQAATGVTSQKSKSDTVDIYIHNQEGAVGQAPVFVQHNGKSYLIPREQRETIPRFLLKVLEDAVETHFVKGRDGEWEEKPIKRFAYTVYDAKE